jgi:hypothetical protein
MDSVRTKESTDHRTADEHSVYVDWRHRMDSKPQARSTLPEHLNGPRTILAKGVVDAGEDVGNPDVVHQELKPRVSGFLSKGRVEPHDQDNINL